MWRTLISLWIAVAVVVPGPAAHGQSDNQPPVARPDALSVDEGEHVSSRYDTVPALVANDSDDLLPPDQLWVALVAGPVHGALTLDDHGAFTYEHDGSETTADHFLYQVHDGVHASAPATVTITIAPQNDAPTVNSRAIMYQGTPAKVYQRCAAKVYQVEGVTPAHQVSFRKTKRQSGGNHARQEKEHHGHSRDHLASTPV